MLRASIPRASPRLTAGPRPKSISWCSGLRTTCSRFRLDDVSEIIRLPHLAYMPLGPRSLLGLANLAGRGAAGRRHRRLLELPDAPAERERHGSSSSTVARWSDLSSTASMIFWRFRRSALRKTTPERVGRSGRCSTGHQRRRRRRHDQDIESATAVARRFRSARRVRVARRRASLDFSCRVENRRSRSSKSRCH